MTLLQSDSDNILLGKIPYTPKWPLNIHIRPVLVKNFEPCNIGQASDYAEIDDHRKIWITVTHNGTVVTKEKLGAPTTCTLYINDQEPVEHVLTVTIHEKTDDHSCFDNGISITIAAEVTVEIDDIPANLLFFKVVPLLVSENNKEYTAKFQTPIFHHLIENQGLIIGHVYKDISN